MKTTKEQKAQFEAACAADDVLKKLAQDMLKCQADEAARVAVVKAEVAEKQAQLTALHKEKNILKMKITNMANSLKWKKHKLQPKLYAQHAVERKVAARKVRIRHREEKKFLAAARAAFRVEMGVREP